MLSTFICGSGGFHTGEDEPWSPKRSKRNSFCRRHSSKDNPYSSRGLDKFSALVADLEEKRRKIYSELGSEEDAPLVRFVYSSSNDCVPIVVKLKTNRGMEKTKNKNSAREDTIINKVETESSVSSVSQPKGKQRRLSWKAVCRRPECYFPVVVVMILVFLAVSGRSAAVLCTSLGWYLIPTLQGQGSKSVKKKEIRRGLSEKKMSMKSAGPSPPKGRKNLGHWKSFS